MRLCKCMIWFCSKSDQCTISSFVASVVSWVCVTESLITCNGDVAYTADQHHTSHHNTTLFACSALINRTIRRELIRWSYVSKWDAWHFSAVNSEPEKSGDRSLPWDDSWMWISPEWQGRWSNTNDIANESTNYTKSQFKS